MRLLRRAARLIFKHDAQYKFFFKVLYRGIKLRAAHTIMVQNRRRMDMSKRRVYDHDAEFGEEFYLPDYFESSAEHQYKKRFVADRKSKKSNENRSTSEKKA